MDEFLKTSVYEDLEIIVDDPDNVEIMIPGPLVGRIIGRNGQMLKYLEEKSGANMLIIQKGWSKEISQKLRITGNCQKVKRAKQLVREFINERKNLVSTIDRESNTSFDKTQHVLKDKTGTIDILPGGSQVLHENHHKIQDLVDNAILSDDRNSMSALYCKRSRKNIFSKLDENLKHSDAPTQKLRCSKNIKIETTFKVPSKSCGKIIGIGGATIKEINKLTGAHCEVDRNAHHAGDEKIFIMRGYPRQIEHAKKLFREKAGITSEDKIPWVDMEALPKTQNTKLIDLQAEKNRILGNEAFGAKKYDRAISFYTQAIVKNPIRGDSNALSSIYRTRATVYEILGNYRAVEDDYTKSLELNPKSADVLLKRARAMEQQNKFQLAFKDAAAAFVFGSSSAESIVERILKKLGEEEAEKYMSEGNLIVPSEHFIEKYFRSFQDDPIFSMKTEELSKKKNKCLARVIKEIEDKNYDEIINICTDEIKKYNNSSSTEKKMKFLLLRGTFYDLFRQHEKSLNDLDIIIDDDNTSDSVQINALIKRAIIYMKLDNLKDCFDDFSRAIEINPISIDIYHHRGQINLLLDDFNLAEEDFQKALKSNPNDNIACARMNYVKYALGNINNSPLELKKALEGFKKIQLKDSPEVSECYEILAHILWDMKEYEKADESFIKALQIDPNNANIYVHRGLLHLQLSGLEKTQELINKALEIDNRCGYAYKNLGIIEAKKGKWKEAIEFFDKAIKFTNTGLVELAHIFQLQHTVKALIEIEKILPTENPGSNEKYSQIETTIEKEKNETKTEKCQQQHHEKASFLCSNEHEEESEASTSDFQTETSMENEIETTFRVPIKKYRSIVGKGGEIIKKINKDSGAHCQLDSSNVDFAQWNEKVFVIRGSAEQVDLAKQLFKEKLGLGQERLLLNLSQIRQWYERSWPKNYETVDVYTPSLPIPMNLQAVGLDYSGCWPSYIAFLGLHKEIEMKEKQNEYTQHKYEYTFLWIAHSYYFSHGEIEKAGPIMMQIKTVEKKIDLLEDDWKNLSVYNSKYVEPRLRKAEAMEQRNELELAFDNAIASFSLGRCTNPSAMNIAERILYKLGEQHAEEFMKKKKPVSPSKHFINSYISSFKSDPIFIIGNEESMKQENRCFARALKDIEDEKYENILNICTEEIEKYTDKNEEYKIKFFLLRGTFQFLFGHYDKAHQDFVFVIENENSDDKIRVNALIKKAIILMQLGKPEECLQNFSTAIEINPDCVDIYHHRRQVYLMLQKIKEAQGDSKKVLSLTSNKGFTFAESCYTEYRFVDVDWKNRLTEASFDLEFESFQNSFEYNVEYAHRLCAVGAYDDADKYFAKAIEIDPTNAIIYVHRGLLQLQGTVNIDKALMLINDACKIDDKCGYAYKMLGCIEIKRGNFIHAIKYFDKALVLARTIREIAHIFRLQCIAKTQIKISEELGNNFMFGLNNGFNYPAFIPKRCTIFW